MIDRDYELNKDGLCNLCDKGKHGDCVTMRCECICCHTQYCNCGKCLIRREE
jgi:hypothetical protein